MKSTDDMGTLLAAALGTGMVSSSWNGVEINHGTKGKAQRKTERKAQRKARAITRRNK